MDIHSYIDQPSSLRQQTINLRSYERNIPSATLQPYLDTRPVMTKYSIMPIVDLRNNVKTPLVQQPTYSQHNIFNPGDRGPYSGYASSINDESELRNQIYAIQDCAQATYIPSSKSSLYNTKWTNVRQPQQPFPKLFEKEQFPLVNPNSNPNKIGFALFNNATRQQTRDLTKVTKCG